MNKLGNEPVAVLTVIAALVQVAIGVLTGHLDVTALTALVTAVSGFVARSQVSPVKP